MYECKEWKQVQLEKQSVLGEISSTGPAALVWEAVRKCAGQEGAVRMCVGREGWVRPGCCRGSVWGTWCGCLEVEWCRLGSHQFWCRQWDAAGQRHAVGQGQEQKLHGEGTRISTIFLDSSNCLLAFVGLCASYSACAGTDQQAGLP